MKFQMVHFKYQISNSHFLTLIGNWKLEIKKSLVKKERGITLIELLLYMGIFSTLLMVFVQLFGTIVNVSLEAQANAAVSQDGRYILNQISYTIAQASTFSLPSGYGSANAGSQLQFSTTGGTTYTYSLSNSNLMISNGVYQEQLNSAGTSVSNLVFTRLKSTGTSAKNSIIISFTLTSTTREQNRYQQKNFETAISGR